MNPVAAHLPEAWRQRLFGLLACVVLATIGLHSIEPVSSPFQRLQGSAFSAATEDVALASSAGTGAARQVTELVPIPAVADLARFAAPIVAARPDPASRPRATSPPPLRYLGFHPGRRAPPRA